MEKPIFLAEQMPPHLAELWKNQNNERHPYALVNPVIDADGKYVAMGAIGKVEPPQVAPVTAALIQISNSDLTEDDEDGADEVKANVSEEAMDIAAARVDAKSGIYLDNFRQSVQREGEIYLSMCGDVYFEPGRTVETMDQDGNDGTAKIAELYTDKAGSTQVRNDFVRGRYKVVAGVSEATTTRRDKTVKRCKEMAEVLITSGDMEGANACIGTAMLNMDGEGINDLQAWFRKRLVQSGVVEPTEEEAMAMQEAAQQQEPDPAQVALLAQAEDLKASAQEKQTRAAKNVAQAGEIEASAGLKQAQTVKTIAETRNTHADTHVKLHPPANDAPRVRMGRDLANVG
jgi:hypothetical protein